MTDHPIVQAPGTDSITIRARHHPFRQETVDMTVPAGGTIAELLEAVQANPVLRQHAHIFIGDQLVPREYWHRVRPKPGQHICIAVVPSGGDGKNPLATILTIAVIAAAAWTGSLALAAGYGTFGSAVVATATGIPGRVLIGAMLPPAP